MTDFMKLMQQAQQMQGRLQQIQEGLERQTVTGTAAGGLVSVEANGKGVVRKVTLDPQVVDPADVAGLEDLLAVAIADAQRKADALQQEQMGGAMGGMDLPFQLPF